MTAARSEYWMLWDSSELASKLMEHHGKFYVAGANPVYDTWVKNTYYYYSNVIESQSPYSGLSFVGQQGELVQMRVPQARSLVRQTVTLVTKQKLAFACIAETDDRSVVEEMRIGDAICEDTCKEQTVDVKAECMVENGLVLGCGYMKTTWRTDRGLPFTTDDQGNVVFEGNPEISTPFVTDVLFDFSIEEWDDLSWVECRVRRNRYDLIAQFPEIKTEILALPAVKTEQSRSQYFGLSEDDTIYVYEMYHKPTPSLPKGRMMFYSDSKTVYLDGENLYGCIPIEQYKPEQMHGIGFGFPMFSALLPAQEMFDHEMSAVATNHSAYGIHNICAPRGAALEVQDLYGLNLLSYTPQEVPGGGKPEPLQLMQASPEAFKFMDSLLHSMQQISNVNAALRGDIGQSTSGVAIATLTTNALEFLNSYSKSLYKVLERTMFHTINAYTRFATTERMIRLTGKNHQTYLKKFKGQQLQAIRGVKMQAVNPLLQTLAGRLEIAQQSMQNGLVTDMKQYAAILDGEPLNTLFETEQSQDDLISTENQMFLDGLSPDVISIDDHPRHIMRHRCILNDPQARKDQALYQRVMDHIIQHNQLAQTTDPMLLAMANTGKMPEQPPPGAGGPPPGAPQHGPPPPQHGGPPPGHPPPGHPPPGPSLPAAAPPPPTAPGGAAPPGPAGAQPGQQFLSHPNIAERAIMSQPTGLGAGAKPAQPGHDMLGRT